MKLILRVIGFLGTIVSVIWFIKEPSFSTLSGILAALAAFLGSFVVPKQEKSTETLDQRNRRVMLDHVENFWVKGVLENSLHGAALLELGIKEDPSAVHHPWTIKRELTNESLPAGKSMLEIFQEVGIGRSLLILGAPGSGKTTILLELARQLIERAREDEIEPIPIVFNLASWTEKQTLADWLADQLNIVYYVPKKIAPSWVRANKMLLLLDGLDEVKQDSRTKCVEAINQFRKECGLTSLIVCSRIEEYAILNTKLSLLGAITLQPLTSKQIRAYFDRLGKSLASVKQLLKKDKSLQELAETPLMLSIITLAYKDRKADELIGSGNIEKQRKHLFDTYITRMFERSTPAANTPFSKQQTLHCLHSLAEIMSQHNIVAYQIEAMQPSWLKNQKQNRLYRLYVRLIYGLLFGLLFGLSLGLIGGLLVGLSFGLIGGLIVGTVNQIRMIDRWKWSWRKARDKFIFRLRLALIFGLAVGLIGGLLVGLSFGLIGGLLVGLSFGLTSEQVEETAYPGQRLKQTLYSGLFFTLLVGLIGALIVGLSAGLSVRLSGALGIGLLFGLSFGLLGGCMSLIQHYSLRLVLVQNHLLPRQLITFLEYGVALIFLRRVGGSYIFVHRLLMSSVGLFL